jgi:hypothetical protein
MLRLEPQFRFLLRGSALMVIVLAVWWLALRRPMLFLLRASESVALRLLAHSDGAEPITIDEAGDWNFRVPVDDTGEAVPGENVRVKIRAMEFTMPRADVVLFTFSVPVYWAIVLAASRSRPSVRTLAWGTAVVGLVEVLALLAHAEIFAYGAAAQLHPAAEGLAAWSRDFGARLIVGVVPFATPVLAAVALLDDLRSAILGLPIVERRPVGGSRGERTGRQPIKA